MIKPLSFHDDGTMTVYHEERDHSGTVTIADLVHPVNMLGQVHDAFLRLPCPVGGCGSESLWPVSAGDEGQRMAVLHRMAAKKETLAKAKAAIKNRAELLDGAGRFQLDDETTLTELRKPRRIKEREQREKEERDRTPRSNAGKP